MSIHEYEPGLYIGSQICSQDFPFLAKIGIRTIICNRPDGEEKDQLDYKQIQEISAQYGMITYYLPVTSSLLDSHGKKMASIFFQVERPLFAYCRSGKRSSKLYTIAKVIKKLHS